MAKNACLEILDLNNDDNLGARFILMHIYAYFEDEKSAVKLFERYDCQKSTQFLLPLSTLYYKLGKIRKATAYIKELVNINKDTHDFFNRLVIGKVCQTLSLVCMVIVQILLKNLQLMLQIISSFLQIAVFILNGY